MTSKNIVKLCAALALSTVASAASASVVTTHSIVNSPVLQVDGGFSSQAQLLTGAAVGTGRIHNVEITIDFTKCDDPIAANGACLGGGFSFNNEIVFSLVSPTGTTVSLVSSGTYSGNTPGQTSTVTFMDGAAALGGVPVSGTFAPVGSLASYIGESAVGAWTLNFGDTAGADPLSLNAWSLTITTPEPGTVVLLGLGLLGVGGFASRRRST